MLTKLLPGQQGRSHNAPDAAADWGSDGHHDGQSVDGKLDPDRNGGMRFYRPIDVADREEREARGVDRLKYTWRSMTGPAPSVDTGDRVVAMNYLRRLEAAADHGGWSTSEANGLLLARKLWRARAYGDDPRYDVVGNRMGGLTKEETSAVKMRQIILDMKRELERSGKSNGD